ncbi:Beta-RFAP synthase [Rubrivivax sp. A210]|uniref:beta-ribofuranosylaminobenzene 5'-phosphate synthase family protein n=1 Tax=Rubrivivax sp. A210 TaxID=2772301 RepID=UPI0019185FE2|nr:beta-ribofuranosylaminobenzene 5'-phosphate synthase family protein [Rubrivivax sp. A210]CAD5372174.1 Beta-RFAP synthase [Rubrivivax sp. A210]
MLSLADDLPAHDALASDAGAVTLQAPARLHLGFLDPAGTLGRPFGSLGLTIEGYETVVEIAAAPVDAVLADTPEAQAEVERARAHIERLRQHTGRRQPLQLRLRQVLPAHAGFGSGTQLALAIGRAFAHWQGLEVDSKTLAAWLGRGLRSGVGIAGFDHGGLLLDGGPGADGTPAPLLSRLAFPPAWCVAVVQDTSMRGLSGSREKQAIARLDPLPQERAAEICHQVLMRVLPGAASVDFAAFAAGVSRVQQIVGEHFAPAQGGSAYTSAAVGRLVQALAVASPQGAATGQSSWGPTGFAVLPSLAAAQSAVDVARAAGLVPASLQLQLVRGRNRGARLSLR